MPNIEFGWSVPSGPRDAAHKATYMDDIRRGMEMVTGRYKSAWFIDHTQFAANNLLEGWTAITYLAALHPQFNFGNAVLCQSFRNPAVVAKMGATLQYMTGGRFILGIGAGWKEDEYLSYGYPFPSAAQRVEELDEALQIIKALWHDEQATFEGKHYRVKEAYCEPKPDPVPTIMVGASKPRMMRLVARHADWWNASWTGIDKYREETKLLEQACKAEGRDPKTVRRTWFGGCACGHTEDEARELAADASPQRLLSSARPRN